MLFVLELLCKRPQILIFIWRRRDPIGFRRRKEWSHRWLGLRWLRSWQVSGYQCTWQIVIDLWLLWWGSLTLWVYKRVLCSLQFLIYLRWAWQLWYLLLWESRWFRVQNLVVYLRSRWLQQEFDHFIFLLLWVVVHWRIVDMFYRRTIVIWDRFLSFNWFYVWFNWDNFV